MAKAVKAPLIKVAMAGELIGEDGKGEDFGYGATQTSGAYCSIGTGGSSGSFGVGGSRILGWRKPRWPVEVAFMVVLLLEVNLITGSGGGGSSYISGHLGCNSISPDSTIQTIYHTNSEIHYSNKVFSNTIMKKGINSGNGYCVISNVVEF